VIMTARAFMSAEPFSSLAPRGVGVARLQEGTWRRRGRARWQHVDGRNVALSHILARWNLHFRAIGVFDQHAILIAPSVLDSAYAPRHRRHLPSAKDTSRAAILRMTSSTSFEPEAASPSGQDAPLAVSQGTSRTGRVTAIVRFEILEGGTLRHCDLPSAIFLKLSAPAGVGDCLADYNADYTRTTFGFCDPSC
jgi:hypothetical protein